MTQSLVRIFLSSLFFCSVSIITLSEAFLTLGPYLDEILEYLQLLDDGGLGLQVEVVAGVEHQHGREADGEVVGVHLVPGGLGGHRGQVVQQVDQAVLQQTNSKSVISLTKKVFDD